MRCCAAHRVGWVGQGDAHVGPSGQTKLGRDNMGALTSVTLGCKQDS